MQLPSRLTLFCLLATTCLIIVIVNYYMNTIMYSNLLINFKETSKVLKQYLYEDEIAQCITTPYVQCEATIPKSANRNDSFGVALLRRPVWMIIPLFFDFPSCEYSNCYFQGEMINQSTRLVIIEIDYMNDGYPQPPRWPHQLYVAATLESPKYTVADFLNDRNSKWNGLFNLTLTYRPDSDIFAPYARLRFQPPHPDNRPDYYSIAKTKTKWAVWHVSNCNTPSGRNDYVRNMQKIIDVDIFGRCGKPCNTTGDLCSDDKPMKYRYYLSFENSFCSDYATEKFFKLFAPNTHIIPIVRGAFNYSKYLPKHTYIDASNFKNAIELAVFLKTLGEDHKTYSKYLEYKDMYFATANKSTESLGCKICKYLNTQKLEKRIDDLKSWMVDDKCREPNDL